jgi:hypothetical protein
MLIPFLFWVGLLAFIAWILTRLFPRRRGRDGEAEPPRDSAEEILRERFARGEVSEGEYLRALEILRGETRPEIRERDDHEGKMGAIVAVAALPHLFALGSFRKARKLPHKQPVGCFLPPREVDFTSCGANQKGPGSHPRL